MGYITVYKYVDGLFDYKLKILYIDITKIYELMAN